MRRGRPLDEQAKSLPHIDPLTVERWENGIRRAIDGGVVVEEPLEVVLDGQPIAVLMRTPGLEKELAVGFCLGEGLIGSFDNIALVQHCGSAQPGMPDREDALDDSRNRVHIRRLRPETTPPKTPPVVSLIRSGCGRTDVGYLADQLSPVQGQVSVRVDVLAHLSGQLSVQQEAYRASGGIHAAAVFTAQGSLVVACEDIGRHNAVDKAVGWCQLRGIPLQDKLLLSTGRASYDMVAKGARVGLPILISISSPTSLAVELAQVLQCTLIGYLRGSRMNVYTHGWRVAGDGTRAMTHKAKEESNA
jgi:FdhD protein